MIRGINRDPVEKTPEYAHAMIKITPILDKEFPEDNAPLGSCNTYWKRKKELLAQHGVEWQSPAELNPGVIFD